MPHPHRADICNSGAEKRESLRIGATIIGALTTAIMGAAVLVVRPASTSVVSDSSATPAAAAVERHFVAGRVLDAEGNPATGSVVRVRSDGRRGDDWVTSSAADGSFMIDGITPGQVHVAVDDDVGGAVESGGLDVADAQHVVLVLHRTLELAGTILDTRGAPVARATLKIVDGAGASRLVVADDEGRYAVRTNGRAKERISVWARGFQTTTFDVGATLPGQRNDVRLRALPAVRGVVVDPTGAVVSGARISACPGNEAQVATSDRAGTFELPATVIGCWVTADHAHLARARATHIRDERRIVVRMGAGGAIEGDAVDEKGRPIGSFAVSIASFAPEEGVVAGAVATEPTDHLRGAFQLDGLAPGTYVLRFSAEGRTDVTADDIHVTKGKVSRGQHVVMMPTSDEPSSDAAETGAEERDAAEPASSEASSNATEPS
jgi:protocatechuate 3,4-dioxygenase beta subunit